MLGARIAALRRNSGLSQASLAKALGISASAVGMYEQGRREPSADGIVRIAALFHVSTDYLLTGTPRTQEDLVFLRSRLSRTYGGEAADQVKKIHRGTSPSSRAGRRQVAGELSGIRHARCLHRSAILLSGALRL